MAGSRQPLKLIEAKGAKHLSKAERALRKATEVRLEKPKQIRAPVWLPEDLKPDFRKIARELLEADMGAAQLDRDTIGRYLVAQAEYTAATRMVRDALDREDVDAVADWSNAQEKYFKQARACANDLGLTISSRCKLVVPQLQNKEENPFLQMLEERQRRA